MKHFTETSSLTYKKIFYKYLNKIKILTKKFYKDSLISLVVFGSVAKDSFSPLSDIDLLIVLESRKKSYEEYETFYENVVHKLEKKGYYIEINPIFKSFDNLSVELPYLWNTDFIILYDKSSFFNNFLVELNNYKEKNIIIKENYNEFIGGKWWVKMNFIKIM